MNYDFYVSTFYIIALQKRTKLFFKFNILLTKYLHNFIFHYYLLFKNIFGKGCRSLYYNGSQYILFINN